MRTTLRKRGAREEHVSEEDTDREGEGRHVPSHQHKNVPKEKLGVVHLIRERRRRERERVRQAPDSE
jgi:hypothetical protein